MSAFLVGRASPRAGSSVASPRLNKPAPAPPPSPVAADVRRLELTPAAMHTLANSIARSQLERFSAPNAENTRNLILASTGYDPWTDWQWPARRMNALAVRNRLNEILKVRHSLAHGFAMPAIFLESIGVRRNSITLYDFERTRTFLDHLAASTDRGMKLHLNTVYSIVPKW